ncbi:MAG TPA: hypothetical protein VJ860_09620 [Polyangia bacterium]|nr:hypothetical protein [Polyangia bacterium]
MVKLGKIGTGGSRGAGVPTGSPWFAMMSEIYGEATATVKTRLSQGLANGFTFHPR